MEPKWVGATKACSNDSGHVTKLKVAAMPIYAKPFKNLLLRDQKANERGVWYAALGTWVQQICSNDDIGLTLTFLTARSICFLMLLNGKIDISSGKMLESHVMEKSYNK